MAITMKKLEVFEILSKVSSAKTRKDKIKVLQENNIVPVRDILQGTFDPKIQWNLPAGSVPYTPNKEESVPSTLLKQHRKLKYFVKGLRESETLNALRREKMFIELCESVHPEDAKLLVSMINKKPLVKGLTENLIKEALPDLIST